MIASENPAQKTPQAITAEVRSFLKKNLPAQFSEESDMTVEVLPEPFSDDYFNLVEVACAIKDTSSG